MSGEDEARSDGGVPGDDELFSVSETTVTETSSDRLYRLLDEYFYAPLRIAWSSWRTRIGIPIIMFYFLMGTVMVAFISPPVHNEAPVFLSPFKTLEHPLGATATGGDMAKAIIHSTPDMLKFLLAGATFSATVGTLFGLYSGYKGGVADNVIMLVTDIMMVLPGLPLVLFLSVIIPLRDPFLVGTVLAIDNWPGLARNLRSQVLSIREESYVEASRAMGIGSSRIITHDIMPQIGPYIMINAAGAATAVIGESVGLYFLGILPFTSQNWGILMEVARQKNALANPGLAGHQMFFPAIALTGLGFGLIMFSQGMDRVWNPRLRARHAKTVAADDEDEPTAPVE